MENEMVLSWRVIDDIMRIIIPIKVKHIFWSGVIYKCYTSRKHVCDRIHLFWRNYVA